MSCSDSIPSAVMPALGSAYLALFPRRLLDLLASACVMAYRVFISDLMLSVECMDEPFISELLLKSPPGSRLAGRPFFMLALPPLRSSMPPEFRRRGDPPWCELRPSSSCMSIVSVLSPSIESASSGPPPYFSRRGGSRSFLRLSGVSSRGGGSRWLLFGLLADLRPLGPWFGDAPDCCCCPSICCICATICCAMCAPAAIWWLRVAAHCA